MYDGVVGPRIQGSLIQAVSAMTKWVAQVEGMMGRANDRKKQFELVLRTFRSVSIDAASQVDVEYAGILCRGLCRAYETYGQVYYPDMNHAGTATFQGEQRVPIEMTAFADAVRSLRVVSGHCLEQFCKMAMPYAQKCKRSIFHPAHPVIDMCRRRSG